jgi:hypothetical protein
MQINYIFWTETSGELLEAHGVHEGSLGYNLSQRDHQSTNRQVN